MPCREPRDRPKIGFQHYQKLSVAKAKMPVLVNLNTLFREALRNDDGFTGRVWRNHQCQSPDGTQLGYRRNLFTI